MPKLSKDLKYILFVGSGRTGSTLVGQLLNNHPEILITNESRILQRAYQEDKKISNYLGVLSNNAYNTMINGTGQYDAEGKSKNRQRWQRDWKDSSKIKIIQKKEIKYIGDKKQGGNTSLLIEDKEKIIDLLDMEFLTMTVVRDPMQVFKSYFVLNGDMKKSADTLIRDMTFGYDFTRSTGGIVVSYESLLEDVDKWCESICKKLKIENNLSWVSLVKEVVSSSKVPHRLNQKEIDYITSLKEYNLLLEKIKNNDV